MSAADDFAVMVAAGLVGSGDSLRWATVTGAPLGGAVAIKYAHDPATETEPFPVPGVPYLTSYTSPAVGDWVLVAIIDGAPVVLGKSAAQPP